MRPPPSLSADPLNPRKLRESRTFGGAQGQRGAATSWSAAPLSIFRAAPIANWQQEAGLPKTAFACNGITALGLIPFHQKCGRATPRGEAHPAEPSKRTAYLKIEPRSPKTQFFEVPL